MNPTLKINGANEQQMNTYSRVVCGDINIHQLRIHQLRAEWRKGIHPRSVRI
jgi:hypothetical protein